MNRVSFEIPFTLLVKDWRNPPQLKNYGRIAVLVDSAHKVGVAHVHVSLGAAGQRYGRQHAVVLGPACALGAVHIALAAIAHDGVDGGRLVVVVHTLAVAEAEDGWTGAQGKRVVAYVKSMTQYFKPQLKAVIFSSVIILTN